MARRVIALTGLAAVGKSSLIKALAASLPLEHLQASALIKKGRHASGDVDLTQDQLRLVNIDENQRFLVRGFKLTASACSGLVILDGHTVIERDDELVRIDARVFGAIGIDSMIFLADEPEAIVQRRRNDTTRNRPVRSIDELRLIQEEAQDHAAAICQSLGIPLHVLRPDQPELIVQTLLQQSVRR
jgi:adenylate kinase